MWAEMPVLTEYWIGGEYDYSGYTGFTHISGMDLHKIIEAKEFHLWLISVLNTIDSKINTPYLFLLNVITNSLWRGWAGGGGVTPVDMRPIN